MKNINFSLFYKANLFLSIVLFLFFVIHNDDYSIMTFVLVVFAGISSAIMVFGLIYILSFIFTFRNNIILYVLAFVFIFIDLMIVIDFFIFLIYKFHINAMVLNIIFSPDALKSLQFGLAPVILLAVLFALLFVFEFYIIHKIKNYDYEYKIKLNKRLNRKIVMPFIMIMLIEKLGYGFAELNNRSEVVSKYKVIPIYFPLTFNKIAYKYFDYKRDVKAQNTISKNASIKYPVNPIEIKNSNKINIFIFAFDAVQKDILTKDIAPNIFKLQKESIVLQNHFSGGNATRFGIFSLMYGINSTYWFSFLDANRGSVLFDVLKRLNYNINIISATNTRWPEFRKTCYVDILNSIKDNHKGAPWQLDIQSKGEFMQLINKYDDNKSIFSFVFLDGPHGYSYPKEFNKFNANGENINYLTAREGSKEIKQAKLRYKNAIYHDDKLLGDMLAKLKEKGLYDDSLIIFTSDHGQEFYEYGFLGHNSAFSRAQTNTPMIIKLPKSLKNKLTIEDTKHFTSHIDIVPTLLSILGVQNKTSDYSNGYSLFDKDYVSKREYVCCANWTTNAIITPEKIYQFTNEPDTMFNNMVRSTIDYKPIKGAKVDNSLIIKVMNENKQFMK